MGFSATTAHLILFVSLLTAGNVATAALWGTAGDVSEDHRAQARRFEEVAHTNITVVGTPTYDDPTDAYTFSVKNTGVTVLDATEVEFVVDGAWTSAVTARSVNGDATTELWLPGETMTVTLSPISPSPTALWVVAGNGVATTYG